MKLKKNGCPYQVEITGPYYIGGSNKDVKASLGCGDRKKTGGDITLCSNCFKKKVI